MSSNIWEAIDEIRSAWQGNRAIVPLVGAGISADSGIPIVRSIVRYFGKFQQMIELGAYHAMQNPPETLEGDLIRKRQNEYQKEPWKFVKDFGWPDRFQLNLDLQDLIDEK